MGKQEAAPTSGPLLNKEELAAALGVTTRWVRRALDEGRLPYIKVGRLVRFRLSDVEAYIEANVIPAREDAPQPPGRRPRAQAAHSSTRRAAGDR